MKVIVRNTADHYLIPGDEHVVSVDDVDYKVVSVTPSDGSITPTMILSYGLRLVPATVEVELEPVSE